jgi:hypothetical protein
MRAALGRYFVERELTWTPYLSFYLRDPDESAERSAIRAGSISPVGFRYVGVPRPPAPPR